MSTKPDYYTDTRLFEVLRQQGRTQRWLASQTGRHESLLTKYRRGERRIPADFAEQAAALLSEPVESLFSGPLRANDGNSRAEGEADSQS